MNNVQPVTSFHETRGHQQVERRFPVIDNTDPAPQVHVVDDFAELSDAQRTGWHLLESQPGITEPFQSLFYNEKWWQQFGSAGGSSAKTLQIFIVGIGNEIIGIFPMLRQKIAVKGVPVMSYLQPLGTDNILTEFRSGLVREGYARVAYSALISHFRSGYRNWGVISLPAGPAEVAELYDSVSIQHPTRPLIESFCVMLGEDLETFRAGLKRNIKESIRKCYNSSERENVDLEFRCVRDADAILAHLPDFYRLHAMRADQVYGSRHRNVFEEQYARQFIESLARDPDTSGLRLFLLEHQNRIVAARLGFETRHGMYLYYSGYDLEFGKYSVMTRLVYEVIKHSIEAGKTAVNLSVGRDVSKTRWSPRESTYKWNLMFRSNMRGRAAKFAITSIMRLEHGGILPALRLS